MFRPSVLSRWLGSAFVAGIALASAHAQATAAPDEAALVDTFAEIRRMLGSDRPKEARLLLNQTLSAHAERSWTVHHLYGIQDLLRLCEFWSKYERPDPADLVSGELAAWNAGSGQIDLRYAVPAGKRKPRGKARSGRVRLEGLSDAYDRTDFVQRGEDLFHPLSFAGNYTLELTGKALPPAAGGVRLLIAAEWDRAYLVGFGGPSGLSGYIGDLSSSTPQLAASGDSQLDVGAPFEISVAVTGSSIALSCNGRRVCSAEKPADLWGGFGLLGVPEDWSLRFTGKAQPAWIQGRVDAAVQANLARFVKSYDAEAALPEPLRTRAAQPGVLLSTEHQLPGAATAEEVKIAERVGKLRQQGEHEAALAIVLAAPAPALGETVRDWLVASLLAHTRRTEEASERLERLCNTHPDFVPARVLRAELWSAEGRRTEMLAEALQLVSEAPHDPRALVLHAQALSLLDRADEANEVLRAGRDAGLAPADFEQFQRLLDRARNGPLWTRSYEHKTDHYHVRSDISQALCYRAAQLLERFYVKYNAHLKRVSGAKKRFRVQLFAGEAGYHEFCADILGTKPEHTAGVYIPLLKQLMIWNLPNSDEMLHTVVHEGFHQYLDQVAPTAPVWFNEGMAEYYESSRLVDGQWQDGLVNPEHAALLRRGVALPLAQFVRLTPAEFYGEEIQRNYAQAWAFVHFLQESGKGRTDVLARFLRELSAGVVAGPAIDKVFAAAMLDGMQNDFSAHVQRL
jgi:hypothetical protein